MFLDLNLKGKNGFDLLKEIEAESFHTIIISAYNEKACEAFNYPVIDFIEKPFSKERLETALKKLNYLKSKTNYSSKLLPIKRDSEIKLLDVDLIMFIKGASVYSEVHLTSKKTELHHQNLEKLDQLLPEQFIRIHKSYIVNIYHVDKFKSHGGSKYTLSLKNGDELPVSRTKYKEIKEIFSVN